METNEVVEKESCKFQIKDGDGEFRDLTGAETATCIAALVTPLVVAFITGVAASDKVKNGMIAMKRGIGNLFSKKSDKVEKKDIVIEPPVQ